MTDRPCYGQISLPNAKPTEYPKRRKHYKKQKKREYSKGKPTWIKLLPQKSLKKASPH